MFKIDDVSEAGTASLITSAFHLGLFIDKVGSNSNVIVHISEVVRFESGRRYRLY
jgi:hypothetical protein